MDAGGRAGRVVLRSRAFLQGHGMDVPALLPRLMRELGADILVGASGRRGVEPGLPAGTVVVLGGSSEHDRSSPLRGWRYPDEASRHFIPMSRAYGQVPGRASTERAAALGVNPVPGVYAAMSTASGRPPRSSSWSGGRHRGRDVHGAGGAAGTRPGHESVGARHGDERLRRARLSHDEVVQVSNETAKAVGRLLVDLLPRIDEGA